MLAGYHVVMQALSGKRFKIYLHLSEIASHFDTTVHKHAKASQVGT